MRAVVAGLVATIVLGVGGGVASASDDINHITVTGEVTSVMVEDLGMVALGLSNGQNILMPCPADVPGCVDLEIGDHVLMIAHFGDPIETCEDVNIRNPVVLDFLAQCEDVSCVKYW